MNQSFSGIQRAGPAAMALLLLAACGFAGHDAERSQPPPVEDTVFGDAVSAMDSARGVQDALEQDKQALERALERSEGGDGESAGGNDAQ